MNTQATDKRPASLPSRFAVFLYGVVSYAVFLITFLYAIGFIGNFGVPKSLDSPNSVFWGDAFLIDLGLLALFTLQHSVMARPAFKRWMTRVIPVSAERSTYVLASSLALLLLFWKWQPLGGAVWYVDSLLGRTALYAGYAFGWALVLVTTFVINHFDLFGLRQVWLHVTGRQQSKIDFVAPVLYRIVRHPLYVGWLFAFWCTPVMTVTHLLFAVMTTAYILIAIRLEEADLMKEHPQYAVYRKQVPMLVPRVSRDIVLLNDVVLLNKEKLTAPAAGSSVMRAIAAVVMLVAITSPVQAQLSAIQLPSMPSEINKVPSGHVAYLKTSAVGTQNYVCLPSPEGPAWTFQGPQATGFLVFPWFGSEGRQQILTHFLSANPAEDGRGRPAWHHSVDFSTVWAKAVAESKDPNYVKPGAVAWLLLEIVGTKRGAMGGGSLAQTTYIHRLNTDGGGKPEPAGCEANAYGAIKFVPYTTDYYFYRKAN